ncbi:hypothetical protein BV25DRAFT_1900638 [Artomyces pyxidatus]|uniref:Uncharacterized protein n=1 Tax=Artomyces pyxidatus TaxID=48021 RepID=A0ACB8SYB6_9AGAM|nr:hypothetical protein BV25DRAFT_1900638 [Artomyces pyxidatus]
MSTPIVDNLESNEFIYQRFVLVTGSISAFVPDATATPYLAVETPSFPTQTFPVSPTTGAWKALVHLQPGPQSLTFAFNGESTASTTLTNIAYMPLLHIPPLHLAVMVASDSPQRMDCPPEKAASPTHSDVEAAKKKMRTWAYMCQAYTAEEMRKNGFGRRSFRLDEEWAQDTLSISDEDPVFRVTAKVHVVPTSLTTAQLRDPNMAQQNANAHNKDGLYNIFHNALRDYGGPFQTYPGQEDGPVVAGHIIDSHYDSRKDLITAHAALGGTGGPHGNLHLGMFGSHTHWAWPRFIEEMAPCLLDATRVTARSLVGNDNGQCGTFWETCCIGQGAALHEVGHAFGLPHQASGIMRRGYIDWNRSFVAKESYNVRRESPAAPSVPEEHENHWHLADLLHLATHPMFALPSDGPRTPPAPVSTRPGRDAISVSSPAGIAHVSWTRDDHVLKQEDLRAKKLTSLDFNLEEVRNAFAPSASEEAAAPAPEGKLSVTVTACDGAQKTIDDFWDYATSSFVPLPGCDFIVKKKSVISGGPEAPWGVWSWAVLLSKLDSTGKVVPAVKIQIQRGAWFDGVYVHYEDGTQQVTGAKTHPNGRGKSLGGNTTMFKLQPGEQITHACVSAGAPFGFVNQVVFFKDKKDLRAGYEALRPDSGEVIVGFYGKNQHDNDYCPTLEFGILTIPVGATLPKEAYGMRALLNTDGGSGTKNANKTGGIVVSRAPQDYEEYHDDDDDEDEEDEDEEMDED